MMKTALRKYYKNFRQNYPPYEKYYENLLLQTVILNSDLWKNAKTIALYHAFNHEVSTNLLIKEGLDNKKTILLPQILDKNQMVMTLYQSTENLQYNKFGILENQPNKSKAILAENIDLIVIPALAIDQFGYRLGYGGGYYDRYLENQLHIIKIGLIYSIQFSKNRLPYNTTDIPVDFITTPTELKRTKK